MNLVKGRSIGLLAALCCWVVDMRCVHGLVAGGCDNRWSLEEVVEKEFLVHNETKYVRVYYTADTSSPHTILPFKLLSPLKCPVDSHCTAQNVAEWAAEAWVVFRGMGLKDPFGGKTEIDISIIDFVHWNTISGCCTSEGIFLSSRVAGHRFMQSTVYHEIFHSMQGWKSMKAQFFIEGSAAWAEDHINLETDVDKDSPYMDRVSQYLGYYSAEYDGIADYRHGLIESHYSSALFWTYFTEQLGNDMDPVTRGSDAMVLLIALSQKHHLRHPWLPMVRSGPSPKTQSYVFKKILIKESNRTLHSFFTDFGVALWIRNEPIASSYHVIEDSLQLGRVNNSTGYPAICNSTYELNALLSRGETIRSSTDMAPWSHRYYVLTLQHTSPQWIVAHFSADRLMACRTIGYSVILYRRSGDVNVLQQVTGQCDYTLSQPSLDLKKVVVVVSNFRLPQMVDAVIELVTLQVPPEGDIAM